METILLLSAKKRHGKDTFLEILQEELGEKNVKKFMLAQKIKQMFCDYWGVNMEFIEQFKDEARVQLVLNGEVIRDKSCRSWLQNKGTEESQFLAGRNVWVDLARKSILNSGAKIKVITDCRFVHEQKYFKKFHKNWWEFWKKPRRVINVKIFREGYVDSNDVAHASETETEIIQPDYELRIPNGRLDLFREGVRDFIKAFNLQDTNR